MKFLSQINVNTEYILPFVDGTNGQVLTTDGNGAVYWSSSAGVTNLNALTDVELTSPSTGQILRYEIPLGGSVPVWRNVTPGYLDPNSSINALGDVVITSATSGQILQFNGTFWINTTLSTVEYVSKVQHTVKAGVAITKGQAVYVTTSDGTNMIVGLASNTSEATSSKVIGLAASNAAINDQIFVVTEGLLAGLNTSTATAGDPVWLGTNGNLIFGLLNKPVAPAHLVYIGVVTRVQSNNGEIFVNVQNGFELNEIHDALIVSPTAGQLLRRDSDNLWKNWTPNYLTAEADTLATVTARGATTTGNITVNGAAFATSFSATGLLITNADTSGSLQPDQGSPANKIYSFRWAGNEQGYIDTDAKITFAGFKTPTGTASQFLKANGTVDSNVYITSAALSGYATQTWVNSNFYNQGQIDDFFYGNEPILGYNKTNWDAAYADKINSASFSTTTGVLTLTQQDAGTITVDLDGRYLESLPSHTHAASDITSGTLSTDRLPKQELGISIVGNFGQWQLHSAYTNFNTPVNYWGWNYVQGNTNAPHQTSSQWYRGRFSLGNEYGFGNDPGDYWMEIAIPRYNLGDNAGNLFVRTAEDGTIGGWQGVRAAYATNANYATSAGDSTNLGGLSSARYAKQDYYNEGYNWDTIGAANTDSAIVLRVESSASNPPAGDVYNWSLWQQGTKLRGSQIAVSAYGEPRMFFRGADGDNNVYASWNEIIHSGNIASQTIGYASQALQVIGQSGQNYSSDNRTISPSEISPGYLQFGFTSWTNNNGAPYADYLHMRSYTDSSGGSDNLVMFKKSGIGMRIWQQTFGSSTAYSSYADVWTTENFSSTDISNWNAAYNDKINSASFNTTNGILTLTQQDGGTVTVDLDGRYLTSDTDAQTLTWDGGSKTLGITNGNDVILSELATEDYVLSQGFISSESDTLASVTGRGASTSTAVSLSGGATISGITNNGNLVNNGKIVVQNYTNGTNARGIFMWADADSNWGIYMATSAAGVSLSGGNSVASIDGRTSHHIRFRAYNATGNGFIWENDSEQCVMSLTTNTGNLYTRGSIYPSNQTTHYVDSTRIQNWQAAYSWGNHADAPYWNVTLTDDVSVAATSVRFNGNVRVDGDLEVLGTITETSSIRFKENITPLDPALDKVNQLEAVSYNKIGEDNREIGLIAEEVAELFPEVVTYNDEGQPQGIQYQRLSVILLKAVQELTERVNKLENK